MEKIKAYLKKKDVVVSGQRYGIDALGAMAQGLFASLLIGTILSTLGKQIGLQILIDIGNYASSVKGAAMAVAIGFALNAPALVLFSLLTVGYAADTLGGAGGPLAVYVVAVIACELGKLVSKETKLDIIVTPLVTILSGCMLSIWFAPYIGAGASAVGNAIMWATELQPLLMGIVVSVLVGIALTLPISSAAICAALSLTGLAGGAAVAGCCAQMVGFAYGEWYWRIICTGCWNQYVTDGEYCEKAGDLVAADSCFGYYRTDCNLCVQAANEWCSSIFRYGNLRFCRSDWCIYRLVS